MCHHKFSMVKILIKRPHDSRFSLLQVLALCLLIASSTAEGNMREFLNLFPDQDIPMINERATQRAAGWLLFLGVITLFYEPILILLRFINVIVLNNNILILIIMVSPWWVTLQRAYRVVCTG